MMAGVPRLAQPATPRPNPLPVLAPVDEHGIARPGEIRRTADRAQRTALEAVRRVRAVRRHVQGRHSSAVLFRLGIRPGRR